MKDPNSKAHDLFLLMFNLSQLTVQDKIIDFFIQALGEIWPKISVTYQLSKKTDDLNLIEISSSSSQYGFLLVDPFSKLEIEEQNLIQNAVSMLAVILKKNEQDKLLSDEKLYLQKLVDEKINSLKESEERFRNVFDYSIVGKSITKIGGKIEANKAFCDMLGYSSEELSNIKWQEITHPDEIERDLKFIDSILSGENSSMRWEKRYIHKDGHFVWAHLSTSLQRDMQGKPLYFITAIVDITERKKAEDEIRKLNELLELHVAERTEELEAAKTDLESKNAELSRFNNLFVGRELRIKELKNKINLLEEKNKIKDDKK
jgi:PAS domain S-box-containing protein